MMHDQLYKNDRHHVILSLEFSSGDTHIYEVPNRTTQENYLINKIYANINVALQREDY